MYRQSLHVTKFYLSLVKHGLAEECQSVIHTTKILYYIIALDAYTIDLAQ